MMPDLVHKFQMICLRGTYHQVIEWKPNAGYKVRVSVMVINATFNNISAITKCCIEYTLPSAGFELALVVIGTDCTGSHDHDGPKCGIYRC
jgi:hypothetical protein